MDIETSRTKRILVTGAAGFIGSHIIRGLFNAGFKEIFGVDDFSGGYQSNLDHRMSGRFYTLDLRRRDYVKELITVLKPQIIYHLAANAGEGASMYQPQSSTDRNLLSFMNVLTPAINAKVKKIVLFSSMSVYGKGLENPPFSEDLPMAPEDIYAVNKEAMETALRIEAETFGFDYTIIRPHNVFGPGQNLADRLRNVIAIFINKVMRGEPIEIYGDGEQERAFSYIADSLPCYLKAIDACANGHIINIGGMKPITINRVAELVLYYSGRDKDKYSIDHQPDRKREVKFAYCSWQKSVDLLGYDEKIGVEDGIHRMVNWALRIGPRQWAKGRGDPIEIESKHLPKPWQGRTEISMGKVPVVMQLETNRIKSFPQYSIVDDDWEPRKNRQPTRGDER